MKKILITFSAITFNFCSLLAMEKDRSIIKGEIESIQKIEMKKVKDRELSTGFIALVTSGYLKQFPSEKNSTFQFDNIKRNPQKVIQAIEFLEQHIQQAGIPLEECIKEDVKRYKIYLENLLNNLKFNKIIVNNDSLFLRVIKNLATFNFPAGVLAKILSKLKRREQAEALLKTLDFAHLGEKNFYQNNIIIKKLEKTFRFDKLCDTLIDLACFFGDHNMIHYKEFEHKIKKIGLFEIAPYHIFNVDTLKNDNIMKLTGVQRPLLIEWRRIWDKQIKYGDWVMWILIEENDTFDFNEFFFNQKLKKYGMTYEIQPDYNNNPNKFLELRIKNFYYALDIYNAN